MKFNLVFKKSYNLSPTPNNSSKQRCSKVKVIFVVCNICDFTGKLKKELCHMLFEDTRVDLKVGRFLTDARAIVIIPNEAGS